MGIFGFILIFLIFILVAGLAIVGSLFRAIFGLGRRSGSRNRTYTNNSQQENRSTYNQNGDEIINGTPQNKKKIFTKEEGEYVDFEEMKD